MLCSSASELLFLDNNDMDFIERDEEVGNIVFRFGITNTSQVIVDENQMLTWISNGPSLIKQPGGHC